MVLGQVVGEVECGRGKDEVQDEGVGKANVWDVARPEGELVRALAAAEGRGCGGGEVEEEFGLVDVYGFEGSGWW